VKTGSQRDIELVERFRLHLIGVYSAQVGPSWSSGGRVEGDFLHHVDLVCSGRRQVVHEGKVTELTPGWAWFLPGCTPVVRRCSEPCRLYFIKFRCEWLPGVDPLLDWPARRPIRLGRWDESMFRKVRQSGQGLDVKHLLLLQSQIYVWLARALPDLEQIISTHVQSHSRFERVFDLMETRLGADLRVCDLAATMRLPISAFSTAFSRSVGMSPKAWISRRLNQEAIKLLLQSDATTREIALELKFADEYHFSRFFKRMNGVAPTPYRQRNMTAGFQDYTLVGPLLQGIGSATPGMSGGQLGCASTPVSGPMSVTLYAHTASRVVGAWAYPLRKGRVCAETPLDLRGCVCAGQLHWNAPDGDWLVALVFVRPSAFDPLHPDSGRLAIEQLYAPFERECPGEVGGTLKVFFQDELDFGAHMPLWSDHLPAAFQSQKGYDPRALLPALWLDLGEGTVRVRLDYADVVSRELERCYFEPVFRWHEARGTLFGQDNVGRGEIRRAREYYADYFRTMRWYSAPGCDDPKIAGERAFKGLKENSSIAHLYQRPRVWLEALHSSGWGTTPAEVVSAVNEDFAYGASVVNLHGLYYTTRGGWWEWAPPDFHFRQPYWAHCGSLNDYFARLSWLLSQGTHACDVAILYPSAALEAEPQDNNASALHAHVGHAAITDTDMFSADPERVAFGLGRHLFQRACDFDFIDFESLARATVAQGQLRVSGEAYRVLLLPAMPVVRFSNLVAARDFVRSGGLVIACGRMPTATERGDSSHPEVAALLAEIFGPTPSRTTGRGLLVPHAYSEVLARINERIPRDVSATDGLLQVLHRRVEAQDVFYLFNPADSHLSTDVRFRAVGTAEQWDAWTGVATPVTPREVADGVTTLRLTLNAREARVIVFQTSKAVAGPARSAAAEACGCGPVGGGAAAGEVGLEGLRLEGPWDFCVRPTLDNRFGDFRLPARSEVLGPEARRFKWAEEMASASGVEWYQAGWDDRHREEATYSFGPRFEVLGPLDPEAPVVGEWRPYAFSLPWGIERDPFLCDWLSGPHGLKGRVPDEFLDFQAAQPGSVWHVRTRVAVEAQREATLRLGGCCWIWGDVSATAEVWVNGIRAGVLAAPPWRLDVTELLQAGAITLVIQVANTLANHYSVGIPSPYAFPQQTRSGLFGPVRLLREPTC
jgi:AraC-like DNA-binding protein